jgi:hypothetical protein
MSENSEGTQRDFSVEEIKAANLLASDLYVNPALYAAYIKEAGAEELARRLALEHERMERQEARELRTEGLVLGALGSLTGAASIAGLAASVAVGPALAPTFLVAAAYLWSRLRAQHSEKEGKPTPPVFSSLGRDLARDREVIRCFSPRMIAPQQESQ